MEGSSDRYGDYGSDFSLDIDDLGRRNAIIGNQEEEESSDPPEQNYQATPNSAPEENSDLHKPPHGYKFYI